MPIISFVFFVDLLQNTDLDINSLLTVQNKLAHLKITNKTNY